MVKHYVPWYTWLLWPSDAVRHVTSYFYLQKPLLAFWYDPSLKTGQSFNLLYYLGMVEEDNRILIFLFNF